MKTRTYVQILRIGFLQMNVMDMLLNLQVCTINNERDVLDRKIKVKKWVFNFLIR